MTKYSTTLYTEVIYLHISKPIISFYHLLNFNELQMDFFETFGPMVYIWLFPKASVGLDEVRDSLN